MNSICIATLFSQLPLSVVSALADWDQIEDLLDIWKATESSSEYSAYVAKAVVGLCGTDAFRSQLFRKAFLMALPASQFGELWARYGTSSSTKRHDQALELAKRPWTTSSEFAADVIAITGLDSSYHPLPPISGASVEFVEYRPPLPALYPFQCEVKAKVQKNFSSGNNRLLLQLPTGSGKTRIAMELLVEDYLVVSQVGDRPLYVWLAHTQELCNQAVDSLRSVWANRGRGALKLIKSYGSFSSPVHVWNDGIVITTYQGLHKRCDQLMKDFGDSNLPTLVVADEAHMTLAPTYKKAIDAIMARQSTRLLGLTATPGRGRFAESENRALSRMYESNLVTIATDFDLVEYMRVEGYMSRLERIELFTGEQYAPFRMRAGDEWEDQDYGLRILERLGKSRPRNELLLNRIVEEARNGRSCLVFACSVRQSRILATALNTIGVDAVSIDSTVPSTSRERSIERFKNGDLQVILNYGVLSTGFDAPGVNTVFIARPTQSIVLYGQMIGRGLRGPKMGGNEVTRIVDVVDNLENFGSTAMVYEAFEHYWS